jgi:hypothetical protein
MYQTVCDRVYVIVSESMRSSVCDMYQKVFDRVYV